MVNSYDEYNHPSCIRKSKTYFQFECNISKIADKLNHLEAEGYEIVELLDATGNQIITIVCSKYV